MNKRCWLEELEDEAGIEYCVVDSSMYDDTEDCTILDSLKSVGLCHLDCEYYKIGKKHNNLSKEAALNSLKLKFTSSNSVDVTRAVITKEEYEAILWG